MTDGNEMLVPIEGKCMKQATLQEIRSTTRFSSAPLQTDRGSIVSLPADASLELPSRGASMVEGTINGFPFRAPLEANGEGHRLRISNSVEKAAGLGTGNVPVEITRVDDEPEVRVPLDLAEALAASPQAEVLWEDITPMARREWVRWIASAKQEETRARRIEVGIDKLLHGMRRPCCFPGLNWVNKDYDLTPDETWLPLPNSKRPS